MPLRNSRPNDIQQFVDTLAPGTRVIWIADGAAGTVQPDRTILWDNGHHMTRKEMKDHHALLIHSEAERRQLHRALEGRLKCLKAGCKLIHWDEPGYQDAATEQLCPIAVLTVPKTPRESHLHHRPGRPSPRPNAA
jgi:hypothetical protein